MSAPAPCERPKLAFIVTEDWYFWSHRLPSARAAQGLGYEVVLITRVGPYRDRIRAVGVEVVPWSVRRAGLGPISELRSILALARLLRAHRPSVVHNVALKPAIYGTIAAKLTRIPAIVNSVTGFGFLFASGKIVASATGYCLLHLLRLLSRSQRVITICQNEDDAALIFRRGPRAGLRIIRGSGVDVRHFTPTPEPAPPPVAVLVGRMLWEKGVGDLVEAAMLLKERGSALRIVLVGPIDEENPGAIREATLLSWHHQGLIEWRGARDDIAEIWKEAHIAVLPSHREGLPKALLEAAACARPIVTTNVPGCREVVTDGITGLLVPPRDPQALASALDRLATSPILRARMGEAGRAKVVAEFANEVVMEKVSAVYEEVGKWAVRVTPRCAVARRSPVQPTKTLRR